VLKYEDIEEVVVRSWFILETETILKEYLLSIIFCGISVSDGISVVVII
jgi:hypothetical protein